MQKFYIALCALILANCGHVPLSSLPKLNQLDMMTLDVEQLRVAVEMPDGLRVRESSAIILVGVRESADRPALEERMVLRQIQPGDGAKATANLPSRAQVFRIAETDLARLEALRSEVRTRKLNDPDGTRGYLTVTSAACRSAPLPAGPILVNTLLKTATDNSYFVLTRNVDLRAIIPDRRLKTEIPTCKP